MCVCVCVCVCVDDDREGVWYDAQDLVKQEEVKKRGKIKEQLKEREKGNRRWRNE